MKKIFASFLLLMTFLPCNASWNSFVYINAETQDKYGFNVIITPVESRPNTYKFTMNAVGYNYKHAWLIVARKSLSLKEQRLRKYIWKGEAPTTELMTMAMLHPRDNGHKLYYEFELNIENVRTGYVYIDFPSEGVEDGYYYTVELNSFLVAYEKELSIQKTAVASDPVSSVAQ